MSIETRHPLLALTAPALAPLLLALALGAGACFNPSSPRTPKAEAPGEAEPLVLRTYEIPQAYAAEVSGIVKSLLAAQGEKAAVGSASIGPGGRVLVAAPEGIQRGVRELVDSLAARKPEPPASVFIEAWIVAGRPAAEGTPSATFPEIAPALDAVTKSQGQMELRLLEKLSLTSVSGRTGSTNGANAEMRATATAFGDNVIADLDIDPAGPNRLSTRVQIANGKLVVLGQSGYKPTISGLPFFEHREHPEGISLFYIVRAQANGKGN